MSTEHAYSDCYNDDVCMAYYEIFTVTKGKQTNIEKSDISITAKSNNCRYCKYCYRCTVLAKKQPSKQSGLSIFCLAAAVV